MQTRSAPIRQNRLANLLIEASPVAVVLTNPVGTIEVVNKVAESWFGYAESELTGVLVDVLFPTGASCDGESHPASVLSQWRGVNQEERWDWLGKRKNGTTFPARITLHPLVTVWGDMLLANVMDLSETELLHAKRIKGERLAAVLEMVSGLAHESRNALQRALSTLDLLELDLADRAELLHLTDRIRNALTDLHNNYEEVRNYATPILLERSTVDLAQLCRKAFDEIANRYAHLSPELHINCDRRCEHPHVDPLRIQQVFHALLENAVQATSRRVEIVFACGSSSAPDNYLIEISIRDYGSGLSEDVAKRMFEPFFTTKQQGTGLGLAICRRIIEAHDGTIEAANHRDGGAIVRIVLPC